MNSSNIHYPRDLSWVRPLKSEVAHFVKQSVWIDFTFHQRKHATPVIQLFTMWMHRELDFFCHFVPRAFISAWADQHFACVPGASVRGTCSYSARRGYRWQIFNLHVRCALPCLVSTQRYVVECDLECWAAAYWLAPPGWGARRRHTGDFVVNAERVSGGCQA